jgi:phosphinothricin acetyltransferase
LSPPVLVRPATESDCPEIARIANEAIMTGVAHFGTVPDAPDSVAASWREQHAVYPWFVAVDPGSADSATRREPPPILGFCRAGRWKPRAAYDWTCEIGIYIDRPARGRGVGKALYSALIPELERRGFRCIVAGMTLPNPASQRLHESFGMIEVGTFPAMGFKHGAWHAVRYYTLRLGDGSPPQAPPGALAPHRAVPPEAAR